MSGRRVAARRRVAPAREAHLARRAGAVIDRRRGAATRPRQRGTRPRRGVPGDARTVAFAGPFDLILMVNFLDYLDEAACATVLRKAPNAGEHVYFTAAEGAAKTLAAARCVASTHGAGHAPMPTTPRMQMRIARPSSAGTWIRSVRTGASMYIRRATSR